MSTTGTTPTDKASRYLQQVCKHWSHRFTVTFDPARGHIDFQDGSSVGLRADDAGLHIKICCPAEANDVLKSIVVEHIDRFAHKEGKLDYVWSDDNA